MNKTLKHIAVILILSTLLGFIRFYFLNDDEFTIIKKVRILNEAKVETNKLGIKKYPIPDVMTEPMIANLDFIKYYFDSNLATIIDARDVDEFNTKHIEGAINIPYDYYDDYADEISSLKYNDIYIIYCSGGECSLSIDLADLLFTEKGFENIFVFEGGLPEWENAGFPIE